MALLQEIQEQPRRWREILARPLAGMPMFSLSPYRQVVGIAEGSSKHALELAAPFLEDWLGLPLWVVSPEAIEEKLYIGQAFGEHPTRVFNETLFIAVSQSGQTGSVLRVLEALSRTIAPKSLPILTLSNRADSDLARLYGSHLFLDVGEERSIAATKTMSSSWLLLLLWGLWAGRENGTLATERFELLLNHLKQLPQSIEALWETPDPPCMEAILRFTRTLKEVNHFVLLSKGPLALVLPEVGLKLTETSSNIVYTNNTESFKHGPKVMLSGVQGQSPNSLYVVPPDSDAAEGLYKDVQAHFWRPDAPPGSPPAFEPHRVFFVRFENSPPIPSDLAQGLGLTPDRILTLPPSDGLLESLLVTLVTFQLISHDLAYLKGESPDNPALEKAVTD